MERAGSIDDSGVLSAGRARTELRVFRVFRGSKEKTLAEMR